MMNEVVTDTLSNREPQNQALEVRRQLLQRGFVEAVTGPVFNNALRQASELLPPAGIELCLDQVFHCEGGENSPEVTYVRFSGEDKMFGREALPFGPYSCIHANLNGCRVLIHWRERGGRAFISSSRAAEKPLNPACFNFDFTPQPGGLREITFGFGTSRAER